MGLTATVRQKIKVDSNTKWNWPKPCQSLYDINQTNDKNVLVLEFMLDPQIFVWHVLRLCRLICHHLNLSRKCKRLTKLNYARLTILPYSSRSEIVIWLFIFQLQLKSIIIIIFFFFFFYFSKKIDVCEIKVFNHYHSLGKFSRWQVIFLIFRKQNF